MEDAEKKKSNALQCLHRPKIKMEKMSCKKASGHVLGFIYAPLNYWNGTECIGLFIFNFTRRFYVIAQKRPYDAVHIKQQ